MSNLLRKNVAVLKLKPRYGLNAFVIFYVTSPNLYMPQLRSDADMNHTALL